MHLSRVVRFAVACGLAVTVAASLPLTGAAHEHRDIAGGQYSLVVGFLDEPAIQGEKNGLSLRVAKHDPAATPAAEGEEPDGAPVLGLFDTLQAEVILGEARMALPLEPAFNDPGHYESYFFPMAEGDYTFHLVGEIEGVAIDETFTAGPDTFSSVIARAPLEFPPAQANGGETVGAATIGGGGETGTGDDGQGGGPSLALLAGLSALGAAGLWVGRRRLVGPIASPNLART